MATLMCPRDRRSWAFRPRPGPLSPREDLRPRGCISREGGESMRPRPETRPQEPDRARRPDAPKVELVVRVYGERHGRPGYTDWRRIR